MKGSAGISRRILGLVVLLVLLGAVAGTAGLLYAWHPALAPIAPPKAASFAPDLIRRGAVLAALGDCDTCHTAPAGQVFAGGLGLATPFGTIYSSNITPDPETGIGRWSEAAFRRALRQGIDREGRYLYPAFPYDHFTLVSDADDAALYAYLMTRQPVRARPPANHLPFPINIRLVLAGWDTLFLHEGPYRPDPGHDAVWNRGAYLAEGLGHCGACHTPRNLFGAEQRGKPFAGGEAEGWRAFTINAASQSPVPWTEDALHAYLATGYHGLHGVARGPMGPVVHNLATVPDADLQAIARYIASVMGPADAARRQAGAALAQIAVSQGTGGKPQSGGSQTLAPAALLAAADAGSRIYAGACAGCHESGRPVPYGGIRLDLSTAVSGESPDNLLNIVLNGLPAADGAKGPIMPGFAGAMNDQQLTELAAYLRGHVTGKPPWPDLDAAAWRARLAYLRDQTAAASTPAR
jgi:mono/diheme cytochrome c family protein